MKRERALVRVSLTELVELCEKVLEGAGLSLEEYQQGARSALWLETRGLDGLRELELWLEARPAVDAGVEVAVSFAGAGVVVAEMAGRTLAAPLAVELGYTEVLARGAATVILVGIARPRLLMKPLLDCARRGVGVTAIWADEDGRHVLTAPSGAVRPRYERLASDPGEPAAGDVQVLLGASLAPQAGAAALTHLSPAVLAARGRRALEGGLKVDAERWRRLERLAERVLVPPSPESRWRGAGYGGV